MGLLSKQIKNIKDYDLKGYKKYFIHYNGGIPFIVFVKKNIVKIYNFFENNIEKLIKEYKCVKIYIPKGYDGVISAKKNILKENINDRGNSILLHINNNKYVYIGSTIYEFTTIDNILDYYSPIGYSDVPYPVAVGEKNVYFMLDKKWVPMKYFDGFKKIDFVNAYSNFYGFRGPISLKKYSKKMKKVKIIHTLF